MIFFSFQIRKSHKRGSHAAGAVVAIWIVIG